MASLFSTQVFYNNHTNFLFLKGYFIPNVMDFITQKQFISTVEYREDDPKTFLYTQVMEIVKDHFDGEVHGDVRYSPYYSGDIFLYEFYGGVGDVGFLVGLHVDNEACLFREFNNTKPRNVLIESMKTVNRELFDRQRRNLICKNFAERQYNWVYHAVIP